MRNGDPFAPLDALADCPDIRDLDALLYRARHAAYDLRSLKVAERRSFGPRLDQIMSRVDGNPVFRDPRATRALEVLADLFARLR